MPFVNISNHPIKKWEEKQLEEARRLGNNVLVDIKFPGVPPSATESDLTAMTTTLIREINVVLPSSPLVVHIMGEMGLTFKVVNRLKTLKIKTVHSTTERESVARADGTKVSLFTFCKFREY